MLTVEQIAEVAHAANCAYAKAIGEIKPSWSKASDAIKASAIAGVEYRILNPWATPEDQHAQWLNYKQKEGWRYGEVLNVAAKTHPCLVLYKDLPYAQKVKDSLYTNILSALLAV